VVRDALLDPHREERSVLDLLLGHAISYQGEFARHYRLAFGESPVETRARALRRPGRRTDGAVARPEPLDRVTS
jgi:hypothetical protein